ncbi:MAG: endonuclease/exonuclease/phosphatase family protein [Hyphomonadaceae bacterium]|nr:endonuclease/exonuclease/phosphatase family protein [Hyphomonadaceae bacterium]
MRIGTWNVEYAYPVRLEAIRRVLANNHADIWVLTETHDDLQPPDCPFVAHSLPRPKNWSGIRDGSRWVSIWSRWPIRSTVALAGADKERTIVAEIELSSAETMFVYGTVMPWKGDRGKFDWSEHHRIIPEQCAEWRALRDQYADAALCVAGDFNTDMGTGGYYGTRQGIAALRFGLEQCGLFCATEPSLIPAGLLPNPPIDHIAVPVAWRDRASVVRAWPADKKTLSDHSGLIVEIARA